MSLADKIAEARPARSGKPCGMVAVFEALSDKDAAALQQALAAPREDPDRLSNQMLANILNTEGFGVSMKTVELHRKASCSCDSR